MSNSLVPRTLLASVVAVLAAGTAVAYLRYSDTAAPVPAQQAIASPSPSASVTLLKVPELGIQLTLPTGLADAYYAMDTSTQPGFADFSSRSLVRLGGSGCEAAGIYLSPLGSLTVTETAQASNVGEGDKGYYGEPIKRIGAKYLYYRSVQSVCSTKGEVESLQSAQIATLKQSLVSAAAIKR